MQAFENETTTVEDDVVVTAEHDISKEPKGFRKMLRRKSGKGQSTPPRRDRGRGDIGSNRCNSRRSCF